MMMNPRREWVCSVLIAAIALPQTAVPAVIVVEGGCTLPQAMQAANLDAPYGGCLTPGSGADTVVMKGNAILPTGVWVADGANGLPSVAGTIVLEGGGHTISRGYGAPAFRLAHVGAAGDLTVRNATLNFGVASKGGGIYNRGKLTLENTTIGLNTASYRGGGLYLHDASETRLEGSSLDHNYAIGTGRVQGGGIFATGGATLNVVESVLKDNTAESDDWAEGGALFAATAAVHLTHSTVSENRVEAKYYGRGGGIYGMDLTIVNSTLSGNTAVATQGFTLGGGIYGTGTVRQSTLHGNEAERGSVVFGRSPGIVFIGSILAASSSDNCQGFVSDGGGNLAEDTSCDDIDIVPTLIGATLSDNGGPTKTHVIGQASSARNEGGDCGLATDQRGVARVGDCDSGAYEWTTCLTELEETTISDIHLLLPICPTVIIGPGVTVEGPDGHLAAAAEVLLTLRNGVEIESDGQLTTAVGGP